MELKSKSIPVVTQGDLEKFLKERIVVHPDDSSPPQTDDIVQDYFTSHFVEPTNDSYIRVYVNPDRATGYRSDLDEYLPVLKKELGLSDDRFEFFLLHVSW